MTTSIGVMALTRTVNRLAQEDAADWRESASCRDEDPELFFHESPYAQGAAKALCRTCPARLACLEAAQAEEGGVAGSSRFGIRGGLTPAERASAARRAARR